MIFETEEVQHLFHKLPTQIQVDYSLLEESLARLKRQLVVIDVKHGDGRLHVIIRISEDLN